MRFIGDVHGHIGTYLRVRGEGPSFQLGDMGLGFSDVHLPDSENRKHQFIRGNHDHPAACQAHPDYAGEFGHDPTYKLFWLGGAFSVDWEWRRIRMQANPSAPPIWWPDEEQSEQALAAAKEYYLKYKPEIVATHDCPSLVSQHILGKLLIGFRPEKLVATRTGKWLQEMFQAHQPKVWLFGHYHVDINVEMEGTRFICLNELSTRDI